MKLCRLTLCVLCVIGGGRSEGSVGGVGASTTGTGSSAQRRKISTSAGVRKQLLSQTLFCVFD